MNDIICVTYDDDFTVSMKLLDKKTWIMLDEYLRNNETNYIFTITRNDDDYMYTGRHIRKCLTASTDFIKIELMEEMFPDGLHSDTNMIDVFLELMSKTV